jgi:uncharacterized protein YbcC (UPF0753/DUF2309 family)
VKPRSIEAEEAAGTVTVPGREELRHLIAEACEPVAQFWPMKNFVHHNPVHGLEHLPFDEAVREARHLLGGNGYLSNEEYRALYRAGRIDAEGVECALRLEGPGGGGHIGGKNGVRRIEAFDVCRAHLLHGFPPLELPVEWTLGPGGALQRLAHDLPAESRRRILEHWTGGTGSSPNAEENYLRELWESALRVVRHYHPRALQAAPQEALPLARTVGDWLDERDGTSIVETINEQMTKWVAAFVDEGMAGWEMPSRHLGLYGAWRDLAPMDFSGGFLGIRNFADKVRALPAAPEDAITLCLERMKVERNRWMAYLSRHLAQLPGWAGLIRWFGENPSYPGQAGRPSDPVQYLAVRLFYEVELADAFCRRKWGIAGTVTALESRQAGQEPVPASGEGDAEGDSDALARQAWRLFRLGQFFELMPAELEALSAQDIQTLDEWLDSFPENGHGPVWLEAYEDRYRRQVVADLAAQRTQRHGTEGRPRAQLMFCIDVRSESMRRHIEAQGPYETHGFAGFFGVAMNHRAFDSGEVFPLCPVLLKPAHAVEEGVRPGQADALQKYASGSRWHRLGGRLFHDLKQHPGSSYVIVDLLGFFFSLGLVSKTLMPGLHGRIKERIVNWFHSRVPTRIEVHKSGNGNGSGSFGFTLEEQANIVENGLRAVGLTRNFARFIISCGHGSVSDNNPYFGALHCGACGGKHGDPNARAFAAMANHPEVRALLKARGLDIPADTWFLGAKHVTTSDKIVLYDLEEAPASHREDLRLMMSDLERACAAQAAERCRRIPRAPQALSPVSAHQHVAARSADWANVRPEWGLSGNAAFLIGRRKLTKDVNLQGRVFLNSYDPEQDGEGKILEKIMTAPLIVGEWINMEHYFSGVDPWFWGSGSKVIHNVVSGVGVMPGSQGDLLTGLPLQTVNDGAAHFHEPMRLLTVIEAPTARISQVIGKHALLQQLFHNGWVNLVAIDPGTQDFCRYYRDGRWERIEPEVTDRLQSSAIL